MKTVILSTYSIVFIMCCSGCRPDHTSYSYNEQEFDNIGEAIASAQRTVHESIAGVPRQPQSTAYRLAASLPSRTQILNRTVAVIVERQSRVKASIKTSEQKLKDTSHELALQVYLIHNMGMVQSIQKSNIFKSVELLQEDLTAEDVDRKAYDYFFRIYYSGRDEKSELTNLRTGISVWLFAPDGVVNEIADIVAHDQIQQQQQPVVISRDQGGTTSDSVGTVMVSSNVQGADVYVDDVFVGNTPASLKLKDGIHIIEVKKSGFVDYRRELRVYSGSELSLRAELNNQ